MTLEDMIAKEKQFVKVHKALYEQECAFYGKQFVDTHKDKFLCVKKMQYHNTMLELLQELKQRRNNNE